MSQDKELAKLKSKLKGRVLIVGVGNRLRGDDGLGPEIIKKLRQQKASLLLLDVQENPENYLEKIVDAEPDTIVFIDAVSLNSTPGTIKVIEKNNIMENSISTHSASLRLVAEYLEARTPANILLLGIQPQTTEFGKHISQPVRESLEKIVEVLGGA